jgi:hypothetical protein
MTDVTIADLVRNGTMNAGMAALLWSAVDDQLSFLTVALPRLAGKTTTSHAILALRPPGMALHEVAGEPRAMDRLKQEKLGGYLVVNEFSQAPMYGYIWGEPVRRVFETLPYGYSLQTSLHARSVDEAMQVVTRGNAISDEQASAFKLVLYIERFGAGMSDFWRRLVEIYEVDRVQDGRPVGRTLYRWRQSDDSFEKLAEPQQFGRDPTDLERRASIISELVSAGQTSASDVAEAVRRYREG